MSVDNPELYFQTKLYSGTGSQLSVTLDGSEDMAPDWIWYKNRGTTNSHGLQDVLRGFNTTGIQSTNGSDADPAFNGNTLGHVSAVGSNGFTVEAGNCANASSNNYVAWCWKAGDSASSNTDGDITSSVSVNTTAGFSIGTYTGSGTDGDTVGTGLTGLSLVIAKCTNATGGWVVKHQSLSGDNNVYLQITNAAGSAASAGTGGIGALNNSTFPLVTGTSGASSSQVNKSGNTHVFYAFTEKKGYSKFGRYEGNGSTDGTYVHLGFRPAWVMTKSMDSTSNWEIKDNKRSTFNTVDDYIKANANAAEDTGVSSHAMDFLSNGFKHRGSNDEVNGSETYIYMAFAESPFVNSNGVPTNAK